MKSIFYIILDILSPSRCVGCGKPVSLRQNSLCLDCAEKIQFIENKCDICSGIVTDGKCETCSDREFYLKKNIAITEYSGIIKELLHNLKFNKRKRIYIPLGQLGVDAILKYEVDIVTSVPMNRKKKWERGFNQSELIAKYLSKKLKIPFYSLLKEQRKSETQRELNVRNRFINVINRYRVIKRDRLLNRKLLIVDDVFTTGATINECARILLKSGAKEVFSLTIARSGIKRLEKI